MGLSLMLLPFLYPLSGAEPAAEAPAQILYTNIVRRDGPWSIQMVKVPRGNPAFELRSVHAGGGALGLSEISDQVRLIEPESGKVIAAVNGDFYRREGGHAGDPRGLQIVDGELLSAPSGSVSFWIDALGEPHVGETESEMTVTWPDGSSSPIGLNGSREPDSVELYTPSIGPSTRTDRGRDIILEQDGDRPWLPLRPGRKFTARVRAVRDGRNCEMAEGTMVLSVGSLLARSVHVEKGAMLTISTATSPSLRGVKTAISGGPSLLQNGKVSRFKSGWFGGFEATSQSQRHPRSAIGWNKDAYFLIQVDGRQRRSTGMTLNELADFFLELGCTDAMNLDGGGSATFWYGGRVRNRPCDGEERPVANALVVVQKTATPARQTAVEKESQAALR